ncbi:kallikrein-6-like [Tetranychus urticae]|uniref:Peptidase S1 domain-containing protein n=1 Tax=Tetranychus urticae TaxID=32264 RepID=T1K8Z7_TETUR|nr:kallikrein-6-like [Tetranychus urticae]
MFINQTIMMICYTVLVMILYSNLVSSTDIEDSTEQYERVAFGKPVTESGKYPYFVSIQSEDPNSTTGYKHRCGGALIERQIMVTAAHCLSRTQLIPKMRILPNYRNTPFIHPNDLTFKIKYRTIHPGHNFTAPVHIKHDIAVVLLDKPDPRPNATIRLPITRSPIAQRLTLIGFGITESGDDPDVLQSATVYYRTDQECQADDKTGHYNPGFNFCTANPDGSVGCTGDSGGPLILTINNTDYIQGVLSSSYRPCGSNDKTNFVNVFTHLDFIHQAISYSTFMNQISN